MNADEGFPLQRPELVAFVLANLFMVCMVEFSRANSGLGDTILENAEDRVGNMCRQMLVPSSDQKSIGKLFKSIREITALGHVR